MAEDNKTSPGGSLLGQLGTPAGYEHAGRPAHPGAAQEREEDPLLPPDNELVRPEGEDDSVPPDHGDEMPITRADLTDFANDVYSVLAEFEGKIPTEEAIALLVTQFATKCVESMLAGHTTNIDLDALAKRLEGKVDHARLASLVKVEVIKQVTANIRGDKDFVEAVAAEIGTDLLARATGASAPATAPRSALSTDELNKLTDELVLRLEARGRLPATNPRAMAPTLAPEDLVVAPNSFTERMKQGWIRFVETMKWAQGKAKAFWRSGLRYAVYVLVACAVGMVLARGYKSRVAAHQAMAANAMSVQRPQPTPVSAAAPIASAPACVPSLDWAHVPWDTGTRTGLLCGKDLHCHNIGDSYDEYIVRDARGVQVNFNGSVQWNLSQFRVVDNNNDGVDDDGRYCVVE